MLALAERDALAALHRSTSTACRRSSTASLAVTRANYPDLRAIPPHARWRHFDAGGVDRLGRARAPAGRAAAAKRRCAPASIWW